MDHCVRSCITQATISLDVIDIKTPCPKSWHAMGGDDRVRFCDECRLNVYDLSALTRRDAESLINKYEGHLCVRFFRRTDGKIATKDCGRARAALRRTKAVLATIGAAALCIAAMPMSERVGHAQASVGAPVSVAAMWARLNSLVGPRRPQQQFISGAIAPIQGEPMGRISFSATQPSSQPTTQPVREVLVGKLVKP